VSPTFVLSKKSDDLSGTKRGKDKKHPCCIYFGKIISRSNRGTYWERSPPKNEGKGKGKRKTYTYLTPIQESDATKKKTRRGVEGWGLRTSGE